MTHPWSVMRASELVNWQEGGDYDQILDTNRSFQEKIERSDFCPNCGSSIDVNDKYCGGSKITSALIVSRFPVW